MAGRDAIRAQAAPVRFRMRDQRAPEIASRKVEVVIESVLFTVRLAPPVSDNGPRIASDRQVVQMRSHRAERSLERARVARGEIADRADSRGVHPLLRHPADPPQALDRQRLQELAKMNETDHQ